MNEFITIAPKGLGRNTPDRSTPDGALLEAINVRFRDGAWRGVGDKQATGYFAESLFLFDGITYHPALPVNTYVVHNSADNKVYTVLFTNGEAVQVSAAVLILASGEVFNRFSHLGNVLLVFTNIKKHILYWDKISQTYKDLTFLPVPVVNVGDVDAVYMTTVLNYATPDPVPDYGFTPTQNEMEYHRQMILGEYLLNQSQKNKDNLFEGFVMVRLAYRLFDGSYIHHTQPFIHHVGYRGNKIAFMQRSGDNTNIVNAYMAKLAVYYNFFNTGSFTLPDQSSMGVVESLDIFVTNPVNAYDLSKQITSWTYVSPGIYNAPHSTEQLKSLIESGIFYKAHTIPIKDILAQNEHSDASGLYYNAKAGVIYPDMTKDITSNELLPSDNFTHHTINSLDDYEYNSKLHLANVFSQIGNPLNNAFHSLLLKQKAAYGGYEQSQQIMDFDTDSHNNFLGGAGGYLMPVGLTSSTRKIYQQVWLKTDKGRKVITSELNKSFVTTFDAHNIPSAFEYYAHSKMTAVAGDGTVTTTGTDRLVTGILTTFLTDFAPGDIILIGGEYHYIESITSDLVLTTVGMFPELTDAEYAYFASSGDIALVLNPIVCYPDYRAYKIRYYYTNASVSYWLGDYDLLPNTAQNIAYHIPALTTTDGSNGMYYPNILALPTDPTTGNLMPSDSPTDDSIIYDTNRMQVSEIFNPFVWPAINSYRFGQIHNILIAISGVQQAMSDSAFGQYPLYVFSQQGIFTIQQGTDILYQSIQPLNNEVLLNRNCLISISGAIVFGTKEGLRVISGSQVEELSTDVEGSIFNPLASNVFFVDALSGLRLPIINSYRSNVTFLTYLLGAKLYYDTENKEIIVSNPTSNHSYAYSFYTKAWFTRTEVYVNSMIVAGRMIAVKRSSVVDDGNTVYTDSLHYVDSEVFTVGLCDFCMIQTRPVNLGNSINKKIARLVSMCNITTADQEYAIQMVAGSNDLITWSVVSYVQYSGDISNMLNINPVGNFKYFMFVVAGERKDFILNQFDVEYKVRFNNKLR